MFGSANLQVVVNKAAEILSQNEAVSADKSMSSKELVKGIRDAISAGEINIGVADSTILQYISAAVNNDPDCPISSGGSWGGYWLGAVGEASASAAVPEPEAVVTPLAGSFKEIDLYPLVSYWLDANKGYTAKDLSSLKAGGKWGNPDIVGVSRVELFGSVEIETVSCEVKLSDSSWETFIFEAISHKRFSNRSWYCYGPPL